MADRQEDFISPFPTTDYGPVEVMEPPRWSGPRGRRIIVVTAIGVALMLGVGIGIGGALVRDTLDEFEGRVASAQKSKEAALSDLDRMRGRLEQSEATLAATTKDLEAARTRAAIAERRADAGARRKLRAARAELSKQRRNLRDREAEVAARERKVAAAAHRVKRNRFSDGVWEVGVDLAPGVYRAPGGNRCYWGILRSANTNAIVNKGGFSENQTVRLREGRWFDTSACGQWTRID